MNKKPTSQVRSLIQKIESSNFFAHKDNESEPIHVVAADITLDALFLLALRQEEAMDQIRVVICQSKKNTKATEPTASVEAERDQLKSEIDRLNKSFAQSHIDSLHQKIAELRAERDQLKANQKDAKQARRADRGGAHHD